MLREPGSEKREFGEREKSDQVEEGNTSDKCGGEERSERGEEDHKCEYGEREKSETPGGAARSVSATRKRRASRAMSAIISNISRLAKVARMGRGASRARKASLTIQEGRDRRYEWW